MKMIGRLQKMNIIRTNQYEHHQQIQQIREQYSEIRKDFLITKKQSKWKLKEGKTLNVF